MRTKTNPSDFMSLVKAVESDAHAAGAVTAVDIDTRGYSWLALAINLGAIGTSVDFQLQHADDDGAGAPGTYANMASAYDIATQSTDNTVVKVEIDIYKTKRWVRLVPTVNTSAADFGAVGVLTNPRDTEDLPAKSTWEVAETTT